jgi:hypothetical protein
MRGTIAMDFSHSRPTLSRTVYADAQDKSSNEHKHSKCFISVLSVLVILMPVMAAAAPATHRKSNTISAVVRWYLLAPPFDSFAASPPLQLQAPLDRWVAMDSTESIKDCEEQRDNVTRMYRNADISSTAIQIKQLIYQYSVCVCSADPRIRDHNFKVIEVSSDNLLRLRNDKSGDHLAGLFPLGVRFFTNTHRPSDTTLKNRNMSTPTLLLGVVIIAITGSLCGWLLEPFPQANI